MGKTDRIVQQLDVSHPEYLSRVTVVTHDLTVPFSDQLIDKIGPIDYIISMASESHVDRSIQYPVAFVQNNINLALNLAEYACKIWGLNIDNQIPPPGKKFLHINTDEVYGPAPEGHAHKEWETMLPSNPYSASKAAQSSILFAYWRTRGLPLIETHTMNIIGELQDPEKFVPMVIKNVLAGETVPIHGSADGKIGSRFYLHARNQADALMFILQNIPVLNYGDKWSVPDGVIEGADIQQSGIIDRPAKYHVVGEREIDNLEMAQLIAKFAGKELKYDIVDFHSSRPGHDLRYALDGTKLAEAGWKAPLSLEDSLKNTVEWTIKHKEWLK
jgi:dTDP-glucose 4,6-dehydratase